MNPSVDKDWYGWVSNKTQTYRTMRYPVDEHIQKWKVAFFFLFHCELNIHVIPTVEVQKLSAFNVAQGSEQLRYLHVVLLLTTYICHQSTVV